MFILAYSYLRLCYGLHLCYENTRLIRLHKRQSTLVTIDTIQRCWWKSILIKKPTPEELAQIVELEGDTIMVDDGSADRI